MQLVLILYYIQLLTIIFNLLHLTLSLQNYKKDKTTESYHLPGPQVAVVLGKALHRNLVHTARLEPWWKQVDSQ